MKTPILHMNLLLAWIWTVFGFASGFLLGLNFHREEWLGGYSSHKRRLYRLAHISFFGLGLLNLQFYFTASRLLSPTVPLYIAAWGFIIGAIAMPVCCIVMAHRIGWRALFVIPVGCLTTAGVLTVWEIAKL